MKRSWIKPLGILLIIGTLFTCVEPFKPKVTDYQSQLVIDALLTNENTSNNYVKLSRTKETLKETPEKVTGAIVMIKDDSGKTSILNEVSAGVYKCDSQTLRGAPGKSYTLYIKTNDGNEYMSDTCTMYEVPNIDTLYFGKDKETLDNGNIQEGVRVYIDSKGLTENKYFKWTYEEWWKFNIPMPKYFEYKTQRNIYQISPSNVTCWKNNKSDEILIQSAGTGLNGGFIKKPVLFIPSDQSDRLLIQYCIQVRQYSMSEREYEFWDHLKQIDEAGGDIFDKQPFPIVGNIHSLNTSGDQVLGYFQVSAVKQVRKYLTRKEVDKMNLPRYRYDCDVLAVGPGDPETLVMTPPVTFDKIYQYFTGSDYIFIYPVYEEEGLLAKLAFVKNVCADCSLTGSLNKPEFWIDLK